MPRDVRMPDGTIIRNVPDGTTKADLQRRYQSHMQKAQDTRDPSFFQGLLEGASKVVGNAGEYLENTPVVGTPLKIAGAVSGLFGGKTRSAARQYKDAQSQQFAKAKYKPSNAGRITGEVLASMPLGFGPGGAILQGLASGALLTHDPRNRNQMLKDAATGAVGNKLGEQVGKRVIAPVAERIGRTAPARALGANAVKAVNAVAARVPGLSPTARQLPLPQISKGERVVQKAAPDLSSIRQNLDDASRLGLPYAMADASPELRSLAGVVTRKSPNAYGMAEETFLPRARAQADRAREAIDQHLAPITDIEARAKDIRTQGSAAAKPYYDEAFAQRAPLDPEIQQMMQTPAGRDALQRAYRIAQNDGRNPNELGFILDDSGEVGLAPMDGRFAPAAAPNASAELSKQMIRTWGGAEVPKNGPIDLVGWLRLNGGLRDQNGELAHMGLGNRMRPGVSLKGQENRFGPVVNNVDGMNFDDAAYRAWETGYFPELNERPDVNTFLNALRDTYEGRQQRFLPRDMGEVERFMAAQDEAMNIARARAEGAPVVVDRSVPAGAERFDEVVPPEAYGQKEISVPTVETLDMVKRGLDARLSEARDALGNLDLTGNPELASVEGLRRRLLEQIDAGNPAYASARGEYARYAKRAEALAKGQKLANNSLPQRKFDKALGEASAYDRTQFPPDVYDTVPELQRGYATAMADKVEQTRLSGNPYEAVYGSTNQQNRVGQLFPDEGSANFSRIYGLEGDMAKTVAETLGNSATARRVGADNLFDAQMADKLSAGVQIVTSPKTAPFTLAIQKLKDRQIVKNAELADKLAPVLFDTTNPRAAAQYISDILAKQEQMNIRKEAYRRAGGLFGVPAGVGTVALLGSQ